MNLPKVIGICGKMGAGKDEVGNVLAFQYGYRKTSLAHELRLEVHEALMHAFAADPMHRRDYFPVEPMEKYDAVDQALRAFLLLLTRGDTTKINETGQVEFGVWTKPTSPPMRTLLQWWGTEYRRAEDEDYWVKKWFAAHYKYLREGGRVSICDVRYNNEAHLAKLMGALWEVYGRGIVNDGVKGHASEKGVNLVFDMYLPNHGTIEELASAVSMGVM